MLDTELKYGFIKFFIQVDNVTYALLDAFIPLNNSNFSWISNQAVKNSLEDEKSLIRTIIDPNLTTIPAVIPVSNLLTKCVLIATGPFFYVIPLSPFEHN